MAATTAIRMPGTRGQRFSSSMRASVLAPIASATTFVLPREHLVDDSPRLAQRAVRGDGEAEELRDLAQQHRQRDAVHVAVADRLREQLGDEAETCEARGNADDAGDDCHHSGQRDRALRLARRKRQHDREDHGRERRVRAQDENAARTEQGVREQRHDGRVEAVDTRHAGCLGVRDADRHEHGRHDETGHKVVPQPGRLVLTQSVQPGKPAHPAGSIRLHCMAGNAARFCGVGGERLSHGCSLSIADEFS